MRFLWVGLVVVGCGGSVSAPAPTKTHSECLETCRAVPLTCWDPDSAPIDIDVCIGECERGTLDCD